jgi:hypothetical protein
MKFGPAGFDSLGRNLQRQHHVQAVVRGWMQVGELAADQERLRWSGWLAFRDRRGTGSRHRDPARLLDDAGKREQTSCHLLAYRRIRRLLIELGVRTARRRLRALARAPR